MPSLLTPIKKYPTVIGSFLGTSLMGFIYLVVNGLPRYFVGDDWLLLHASRSPSSGYASSLIGCLNDVGQGKWRPMFVCIVTPALKLFGDSYWCFFLLNLAMIFLVSLTAGNLLRRIVKLPEWIVSFCVFIVPFSRFTWYGRISPFGVMEFGALLFALLFAHQFMRALTRQTKSSWYLAGGLASLSSLFHERYLVLLGAGFLVSIFNMRNKRTPVPSAPWLLFLGWLLAIKATFLGTDPLIGGGEVSFRSSADTWILEHFVVGVKAIAGIGNGTIIFFNESGYWPLPDSGMFGEFWLVALLLIVLVISTLRTTLSSRDFYSKNDTSKEPVNQEIIACQLLLTSGLLLIIPASTVISRIEGRWLFGPEVFLFIFMIAVLRSHKWRFIFMSSLLLFNIICLKFLPEYEKYIRIPNQILEYVDEELEGRTDLVYTVVGPVIPVGNYSVLEWPLGYDSKFKQIGVKSFLYVDSSTCTNLNNYKKKTCVSLVFENTSPYSFVIEP